MCAVLCVVVDKKKSHSGHRPFARAAVRMLSVVAGYGGGVCLSMRCGTPAILAVFV